MSFDFTKTVPGFPEEKTDLDIYFQPALTWTENEVKGVAMLFLENVDVSSDPDKQDFREMIKILVRWVWVAYEKSETNDIPTLEALEEIFEAFIRTPLAYSVKDTDSNSNGNLETFLENHFNFRIQEYALSSDLEATVFPMFPHLHLSLGDGRNPGSFSQKNNRLDKEDIEKLQSYSQQFKSRFDPAAQNPPEPTIRATHLPEFIFTGYFRMLIRSGLQEVINILSDRLARYKDDLAGYEKELARAQEQGTPPPIKPEKPFQSTLRKLLDEEITDAQYQNIAGMASTFLLNGFRVPTDIFDDAPAQALYEATGQQFTFEDAKVEETQLFKKASNGEFVLANDPKDKFIHYPVTIQNPDNLPYLKDQTGKTVFEDLTYRIDEKPEVAYPLYKASLTDDDPPKTIHTEITYRTHTAPLYQLSQELKGVDFPPDPEDPTKFPGAIPVPIDFYKAQNMNFALRQAADWNKNGTGPARLLPLPGSLKAHLLSKKPKVDLYIWPGGKPELEMRVENPMFSWVSMIKFTVKRIPNATGKGFLAHTYEIIEGNDDDLNLLEDIFDFLKKDEGLKDQGEVDPVDLYLAFAPSGDAADLQSLKPAAAAGDIQIFRSNLSNNTPEVVKPAFSATLKQKNSQSSDTGFLRLIWEGCTVATGGFYLYVEHKDPQIDESWFKGEPTAALHLIIEFTNTNDPIHQFNNAVLLAQKDYKYIDIKRSSIHDLYTAIGNIPGAAIGNIVGMDSEENFRNQIAPLTPPNAEPVYQITKALLDQIATENEDDPTDFDAFRKVVETEKYELNPETDLIVARSSAMVPVLVIPPGHIGFKLVRSEMSPDYDKKVSAAEEVKNLYHMLGFNLADNTNFQLTQPSVIGPTVLTELDQEKWLYERLIPAFTLLEPVQPESRNIPADNLILPPKDKDPYLGINSGTKLPVNCWWQDIYGNQIDTTSSDGQFPLRYTDPLIGLNQWPSVNENFRFREVDDETIALELEFSFDISGYPTPGAPEKASEKQQKRLQADLLTYQKIYYQIIQADISLSVQASVDTDWSIGKTDGLDNENLIGFVVGIYRYLNALDQETPVLAMPPRPGYTETFLRKKSAVTLPQEFIFEITVRFTIGRQEKLVHNRLKKDQTDDDSEVREEHRDVCSNTAYLTPIDAGTMTVRDFALDFERAFPDLRLAVSEDRLKKKQAADIGRPYFAVQLGTAQGISYDISEKNPAYFALPPLANTLLAGKVPVDDYLGWKEKTPTVPPTYKPDSQEKQFEAIDLNVLARAFLVAIEELLEPESLVAAMRLDKAKTKEILDIKLNLANWISQMLDVILLEDEGTGILAEAAEAFRQALLVHLVKGYDIETAVQFQVEMNIGPKIKITTADGGLLPRLMGTAVVKNVWFGEDPRNLTPAGQEDLDFSLSAGKIDLPKSTGRSTFTYLFDTKTPEKFASIHLELEFRVTGIEYEIEKVHGIPGFHASNWLSLVLPENRDRIPVSANPNYMGICPVPIPLRDYPTPPSLIYQAADVDESSRTDLEDIRQWEYTIIYEHEDIAQDSIDCLIRFNTLPTEEAASARSTGTGGPLTGERNLFQALVNFNETYPAIAQDLALLRDEKLFDKDTSVAKNALMAFKHLAAGVSAAWSAWQPAVTSHPSQAGAGDAHYVISEEGFGVENDLKLKQGFIVPQGAQLKSKLGGGDPEPLLALPGYQQKGDPVWSLAPPMKTYTFLEDPTDQTFFGDSSIPDRKFTVENLDVIEHQNAWAAVWLSRNKILLAGHTTNPKFIFQTPAVRFANQVSPFITNDEPWDLATLHSPGNQPENKPLLVHLQRMLELVAPATDGLSIDYEVRLSCRYAFALAAGAGLNADLVSTLPLLMGLRLNPKDQLASGEKRLAAYPKMLSDEINLWLKNNQPSEQNAALIFSINLFSKLDPAGMTSLPMLRIKHLELKLKNISG